jgi:hypothetical protein
LAGLEDNDPQRLAFQTLVLKYREKLLLRTVEFKPLLRSRAGAYHDAPAAVIRDVSVAQDLV